RWPSLIGRTRFALVHRRVQQSHLIRALGSVVIIIRDKLSDTRRAKVIALLGQASLQARIGSANLLCWLPLTGNRSTLGARAYARRVDSAPSAELHSSWSD